MASQMTARNLVIQVRQSYLSEHIFIQHASAKADSSP